MTTAVSPTIEIAAPTTSPEALSRASADKAPGFARSVRQGPFPIQPRSRLVDRGNRWRSSVDFYPRASRSLLASGDLVTSAHFLVPLRRPMSRRRATARRRHRVEEHSSVSPRAVLRDAS